MHVGCEGSGGDKAGAWAGLTQAAASAPAATVGTRDFKKPGSLNNAPEGAAKPLIFIKSAPLSASLSQPGRQAFLSPAPAPASSQGKAPTRSSPFGAARAAARWGLLGFGARRTATRGLSRLRRLLDAFPKTNAANLSLQGKQLTGSVRL